MKIGPPARASSTLRTEAIVRRAKRELSDIQKSDNAPQAAELLLYLGISIEVILQIPGCVGALPILGHFHW